MCMTCVTLGLLDEVWPFSRAQIRKLSIEKALKRPVNAGSPDLSLKLAQIKESIVADILGTIRAHFWAGA